MDNLLVLLYNRNVKDKILITDNFSTVHFGVFLLRELSLRY